VISRQDLDEMLDEYYSLRGWDVKTGNAHPGKADRARARLCCGCTELVESHAMRLRFTRFWDSKERSRPEADGGRPSSGIDGRGFPNLHARKVGRQALPPASLIRDGAVLPYVRIMVNGQTIDYLEGIETPLKEGDEVLILPPVFRRVTSNGV